MKIEVIGDKVSLDISGAYTVEELNKLIEKVAQARAQIANDPPEMKGNVTVQAIGGMPWWTEFKTDLGMSLFTYRHPGLGWIGVMLKPFEVAQLIGYFASQLNTAITSKATVSVSADDTTPNMGSGGRRLLH